MKKKKKNCIKLIQTSKIFLDKSNLNKNIISHCFKKLYLCNNKYI